MYKKRKQPRRRYEDIFNHHLEGKKRILLIHFIKSDGILLPKSLGLIDRSRTKLAHQISITHLTLR